MVSGYAVNNEGSTTNLVLSTIKVIRSSFCEEELFVAPEPLEFVFVEVEDGCIFELL